MTSETPGNMIFVRLYLVCYLLLTGQNSADWLGQYADELDALILLNRELPLAKPCYEIMADHVWHNGGSPKRFPVPLFLSKVAIFSHVSTCFPYLFPFPYICLSCFRPLCCKVLSCFPLFPKNRFMFPHSLR